MTGVYVTCKICEEAIPRSAAEHIDKTLYHRDWYCPDCFKKLCFVLSGIIPTLNLED